MKATIYIPDEQSGIYTEAKEKLGESVSKTFLKCLERELAALKAETGRIVVEVVDPGTERSAKKAFEGRWVVGSAEKPERFEYDEEVTGLRGGGYYAVAATKAGRLVVLGHDERGEQVTEFVVHDTFEDFSTSLVDGRYPTYPESLIQAVAAEMAIDRIEEMDI
jgi:hypothetical protein